MKKTLMSNFKRYQYNTCNDLKTLSGEDIIRLNPSHVSVDLFNNYGTREKCNDEQNYAIDHYLRDLKILKRQGQLTENEVEEQVSEFRKALRKQAGDTLRAAKSVRKTLSDNSKKGGYRRRRRNTKKKRKN